MAFNIRIACALSLFFVTASASFLPTDLYCWFWQASTVANGWLYIDSGEIHSKSGGTTEMNFTLSIDLSSSWTTSNVTPIVTLHQNSNDMLVRDASMFYDGISNMVYWYGGYPYFGGFQPAVWGFTPNNGAVSWQNIYDIGITHTTSGSTFPGFTYTVGSLWASTSKKLLQLRRIYSGLYRPITSIMARSDVPDIESKDFQYTESHVPIYGKEGILVFLGGDAPTSQVYVSGSPMPISRLQFCAAGVAAADNSSFEIFIYGGVRYGTLDTDSLTADQASDFSKVYILSLPAFTWVQVPASADQRASHTCKVIGNRQVISIGGAVNNNSTFTDPWPNGMGIFDMTELTWGSNYNATAAPYVPSKPIAEYYNSSSRYPSSWASQDLKTIFGDTGTTTVTNTTTSGATAKKPTDTGSIVGGVVGGLAFLAVVVLGAFLFGRWRSRKNVRSELDSNGQQAYSAYNYYGRTEMEAQTAKDPLGHGQITPVEMNGEQTESHQPLMKSPAELDSQP